MVSKALDPAYPPCRITKNTFVAYRSYMGIDIPEKESRTLTLWYFEYLQVILYNADSRDIEN